MNCCYHCSSSNMCARNLRAFCVLMWLSVASTSVLIDYFDEEKKSQNPSRFARAAHELCTSIITEADKSTSELLHDSRRSSYNIFCYSLSCILNVSLHRLSLFVAGIMLFMLPPSHSQIDTDSI